MQISCTSEVHNLLKSNFSSSNVHTQHLKLTVSQVWENLLFFPSIHLLEKNITEWFQHCYGTVVHNSGFTFPSILPRK